MRGNQSNTNRGRKRDKHLFFPFQEVQSCCTEEVENCIYTVCVIHNSDCFIQLCPRYCNLLIIVLPQSLITSHQRERMAEMLYKHIKNSTAPCGGCCDWITGTWYALRWRRNWTVSLKVFFLVLFFRKGLHSCWKYWYLHDVTRGPLWKDCSVNRRHFSALGQRSLQFPCSLKLKENPC